MFSLHVGTCRHYAASCFITLTKPWPCCTYTPRLTWYQPCRGGWCWWSYHYFSSAGGQECSPPGEIVKTPTADLNIVIPARLELSVLPHKSWTLLTEREVIVTIDIYDEEGSKVHLSAVFCLHSHRVVSWGVETQISCIIVHSALVWALLLSVD